MTIHLSALDDRIAERSLLKHPFYQAWSKGELSLGDLQVYAKEYFHLVDRIPGIVARVRDRVTDPALKQQIEQNRIEEQEHVELWKRFGKSLGLTESDLVNHVPTKTVLDAVKMLEDVCEKTADDGIACMYALEAELPKIAQTKKQGLSDFYGLTSEDAQMYFDEHLGEEKHLEVWRSFSVDSLRGVAAAETSLTAQNLVLDAVCAECDIAMSC